MAELNSAFVNPGRYRSFVGGVICTQFVNSALHLAQPLLMADLTNSMGYAALFSSFDTAVHMTGTYLSGWPTDRLGARRVLILATLLRGVALAAIPLAMMLGEVPALWAAAWYTVDALVRGFVDSAVYTLPLELAEHDAAELDRVNARFELAFDAGGIAGPLALGGMMAWMSPIVAHAVIPLGFIISGIVFLGVPKSARVPRKRAATGGTWQGAAEIFRNRGLLLACLGYMSFNLYPLRKLLSAFFAKSLLKHKAAAGPIGAAFSAGGLIGSLIYARWRDFGDGARWIFAGALGMLVLALGWAPASLPLMAAAAFVFAVTNSGARLTLTRIRQELTPLELSGGVTSASRFGANLISVGGKSLVGAAFAVGAGPVAAFSLVGGLLGGISVLQLIFARRFVGQERETPGLDNGPVPVIAP